MSTTHSILDDESILDDLEVGKRTVRSLPHGGFLFLEHDVPSLLIYRKKPEDNATLRLARTSASYLIIGEDNFDYFRHFLVELTEKMAARFGSFILIEIYSGKTGSTQFVIKGPSHKLPASLKVLATEFEKIDSRRHDVKLTTRIEQTKERQLKESEPLFDIEEIKKKGGTLLGIEIPPVYRDSIGQVYPIYFKSFRESFAQTVQQAIFEFIRVQTSSKISSYNALGKREIHEEVLKIDKQITAIQSSYQFLLLVAPVNIQSLRERFFESNFHEINSYHYRLLPIDPDILKRRLYNLRIDEIDDPALAYLYDQKREEIDQELTMLKERGSRNFFYSSIRLHKDVPKNILAQAKLILENIPENQSSAAENLIDAHDFKKLAEEEFEYFKEQSPDYNGTIHIRKDVNIIMVSQGELYLPADYKMSTQEAQALIQHEIGTHALTYYNGSRQTLSQLAAGFADYDATQEGMAVLAEYLGGGLSGNRLRILAGRVVAGAALIDGADFKSMFNLLHFEYGFVKERAFNITSRMFQGGGFLKDIIYLKGLVELQEYLEGGGELEPLLAGKYSIKHAPLIKDLTERNLLKPATIKPRYLKTKEFQPKMRAFKEGIALSKMI
ncbi:flavohemoglobin expression-modulating QEGLA motif protein [Leeuwenhoekiella sp. A2]|uniref:flavohemoglobin expression-modulating QEGLA motif protein n=1 Tax=Leeuwenhoekiella sp. A2 TaxID=3141460 RepID=UPI003A7F8286